jgi:hypothetical protein
MLMVYNHFIEPSAVAKECHRVLRRGGYSCVRKKAPLSRAVRIDISSHFERRSTPTHHRGGTSRPFFAATRFSYVLHHVVTQVTAPNWPSFVEKSALRADAFLARLSDDDFEQGMTAVRSPGDDIKRDDAVTEEIDWFVFTRPR